MAAHMTPPAGRDEEKLPVAEERQLRNVRATDDEPAPEADPAGAPPAVSSSRVKFEIYGEEMIEKRVKASGNSGRVYLPPDWVGHKVKIIRID
jgi:putative transposon-encoded protein